LDRRPGSSARIAGRSTALPPDLLRIQVGGDEVAAIVNATA
jgi:hypothetical protein